MKKMKKFLAFALAMIMCLGMAVTVSAADGDPGHIVMKNATPNTKYEAYRLFDANPAATTGDNTTAQVAYTATATQKAWFERQTDNPFNFEPTANADIFNVSVKEGADVIAFLDGLYTKEGDTYTFTEGFTTTFAKEEATADDQGNVNFGDVPYGYYLITSGLGATVTVSSTNPTATVIDKNVTEPTFPENGGKVIVNADGSTTKSNTVDYGEKVDFKVSITSSNYDGEELVTSYVVKDLLDAGMEYVKKDGKVVVEVKVDGKDAKEYTVNEITENGKSGFTVTIPWATGNLDTNGNLIASSIVTNYSQGAAIEITYAARVTTQATPGTAMENAASFKYYTNGTTEDPKGPEEPEKTQTTTYSFDLVKTNEENKVLSGAKFSLYEAETGGTAVKFVKESNNLYHKATDEEIDDDSVAKTETIEAGNVTVKGLAGENTYYLEETEAPDGYNMITAREAVAIGKANLVAVINDGLYVEGGVEVENKAGSLLPSTGGIGTTIFYVVGGILVVAAGVLLITKKRMSKEQ